MTFSVEAVIGSIFGLMFVITGIAFGWQREQDKELSGLREIMIEQNAVLKAQTSINKQFLHSNIKKLNIRLQSHSDGVEENDNSSIDREDPTRSRPE